MDALKGFAIILLIIVTGCTAADTQPRNLMIVPKGTMVGDYRTQSDGLYLSEQTAARLVRKINDLEAAAKGGLE